MFSLQIRFYFDRQEYIMVGNRSLSHFRGIFLPGMIAFSGFLIMLLLKEEGAAFGPGIKDPDSALRLVLIRAWLEGEMGWFDQTLLRLDPPDGTSIHWSRLIDVPVAGLILGLGFFFSPGVAEELALLIWPLGLGLIVSCYMIRLGRLITGSDQSVLPSAVAALIFLSSIAAFYPRVIDHHNIQLLLCLMIISGVFRLHRHVSGGSEAGIACGVSVMIGMETSLFVLMSAAFIFLRWAGQGGEILTASLKAFGLSLAGTILVLTVFLIEPAAYRTVSCDAFSFLQGAILVVGGLGMAGLASLSPFRGRRARFLGGAGLAGGVSWLIFIIAPQCWRGPYSELHPRLASEWLPYIDEAEGFIQVIDGSWEVAIVMGGVALVSAMSLVFLPMETRQSGQWGDCFPSRILVWYRRESLWPAMLMILLILVAGVMTAIQIRIYGYFVLFCMPGLILLVTSARMTYKQHRGIPALGRLLLAWSIMFCGGNLSIFLFVFEHVEAGHPPVIVAETVFEQNRDSEQNTGNPNKRSEAVSCHDPAFYQSWAQLPPGLVLNALNLAPYLLLYTPHQVVGGNYHRAPNGILDSLDFFSHDWSSARAIAERRGVLYVALCEEKESLSSRDGVKKPDTDSQYRPATRTVNEMLRSGDSLPDWVTPLKSDSPTPVRFYRLDPGRSEK